MEVTTSTGTGAEIVEEGRKSFRSRTVVLQHGWGIGMPDGPGSQAPPISLQHCFSSAVSWASGTIHAMIGPPRRRAARKAAKMAVRFIDTN